VEAPGKITDEYPAFVLKEFDGSAAAFFVQHGNGSFVFFRKTFSLFRSDHFEPLNQPRQDSSSSGT